jgi:hypothetical protein
MPLPSDPTYVSPAPAYVQESPIFQRLLAQNDDPYAAHSLNMDTIMQIEQAIGATVEG